MNAPAPRYTSHTQSEMMGVEIELFSRGFGDRKIKITAKSPMDSSGMTQLKIEGLVPGLTITGEVKAVQLRKLATHLNAAGMITQAWTEGG